MTLVAFRERVSNRPGILNINQAQRIYVKAFPDGDSVVAAYQDRGLTLAANLDPAVADTIIGLLQDALRAEVGYVDIRDLLNESILIAGRPCPRMGAVS